MTINSGKVLFSRVKKDDDFGINRKAEVEISFSAEVPEDPQAVLDHASAMAIAKVNEILGAAPAQAAAKAGTAVAAPPVVANDKDALAAKITAPKAPKAPKPAAKDPADVATAIPASAPTPEKDPASVDEWAGEAKEVTDVDLTGACSRAAQKLGDATPIKKLIAEFVGQKTLKEIPQASRGEFLARLEKLGGK